MATRGVPPGHELVKTVRRIAAEVARPASALVDKEARFPHEAIKALKDERLLAAAIPRELGGADTINNLWPQSVRLKPYGADRKELLTEVLIEKVRNGRMTLAEAQEAIRRDWIDAFVDHIGMVYLR
jgi:alkylation response protein AidB-like acyl-CoA dehydrogenase